MRTDVRALAVVIERTAAIALHTGHLRQALLQRPVVHGLLKDQPCAVNPAAYMGLSSAASLVHNLAFEGCSGAYRIAANYSTGKAEKWPVETISS